MNHVLTIIAAFLLGSAYYVMMELSLPDESNCSYLATPMTDILAFAAGAIIIRYGIVYDNCILTAIGAAIVVEHIWQLKRKGLPWLRGGWV